MSRWGCGGWWWWRFDPNDDTWECFKREDPEEHPDFSSWTFSSESGEVRISIGPPLLSLDRGKWVSPSLSFTSTLHLHSSLSPLHSLFLLHFPYATWFLSHFHSSLLLFTILTQEYGRWVSFWNISWNNRISHHLFSVTLYIMIGREREMMWCVCCLSWNASGTNCHEMSGYM